MAGHSAAVRKAGLFLVFFSLAASAGSPIRVSDAAWRILGFYDLGKTAKSNNLFHRGTTTAGRFVMVAYEVESELQAPDRIYRHPRIMDEQGRSFDPADHQGFLIPEGKETIEGEQLPPGVPKEFWAVYEVSASSREFRFEARTMSQFGDSVWVPLGAPEAWPQPASKPSTARQTGCSKLYAALHPEECPEQGASADDAKAAAAIRRADRHQKKLNRAHEERQSEQEAFVGAWLRQSDEERRRKAITLEWDQVNALPADKMLPEEMARWTELNEAHLSGR